MRSFFATAWTAVVFLGLLGIATVAQAGSFDLLPATNLNAAFQWGYGSNVPNGSYQNSCQNISMNGSQLQARCQRADGGWNNSVIDLRQCGGGDITNDNGNLRCTNNGGWQGNQVGTYGNGNGYPGAYSQANVPQGDYLQTCQRAHMEGSRLEARCQDTNGNWRRTSIDMNQCGDSNISNNNGQLQCGNSTGGWNGGYGNQTGVYNGGYGNQTGGWNGPYQGQGDFTQTCRNVQYRGDEIRANCQRRNGSWNNTELDDYRNCRGQIVNDDGNLRCNQ